MNCIFCDFSSENIELENSLAFAIYDKYPVNKGHILIMPRRHFSDFFSAEPEEITAIHDLLHKAKELLEEKYDPDGYNIGVNINEAAGQTIMHLHVHLIPRYKGDVDDPRGGIRNFKEALVPYYGD